MPSFPPTDEQQKIVDAALTGFNLVVTAGAGTGKTSTMELVARAMRGRGLYAAFNKAAQLDAEARMPKSLKCMTSSALCRRYIVDTWGIHTWNERMNVSRQNGWAQAKILGIRGPHRISAQKVLAPQQVARLVMETVDKFCFSADQEIGAWHVPKQTGITDPDERRELVAVILPFARRAWADVSGPRGDLKFSFDYAMKVWHLSGAANLAYDYIILDEAQDTNASWGSILSKQQTQLMVVGDGNQSLYHWRGASNAMPAFAAAPNTNVLQLSQSFRFGPAVAHEANKWLSLLDSDLRLKGFDKIASVVGPCDDPDAILCRTNAEAMVNVIRYQQAGIPVALVGGGDTMRRLAEASVELKEKGSTWHPDLCAFTSWGAVVDYCLAPGTRVLGADLRWHHIEDLEVGDKLVGFDEDPVAGNKGRRFRTAEIEASSLITRPSYRLTFNDGTEVISSAEHKWLCLNGGVNHTQVWRQTENLRVGATLLSVGRPWQDDMTRDGGWLAGMYDGEGHITAPETVREGHRTRTITVAQKEGPLLDDLRRRLKERGFDFDDRPRKQDSVHQLFVRGGLPEQMRLLGTLRPERLLRHARAMWEDRQIGRVHAVKLMSIEPVGDQPVVAVRTSTRTFIAEGLLSHNCENDHGAGDLKVFVDLIEDYGADAIIHAANTVVTEDKAQVIVSTGHKAKGREWKKVRIAEDFPPPHKDDSGHTPLPDREAMMLAYVAVTRAQQHLDPIGLAWVDQFLAAARQPVFA